MKIEFGQIKAGAARGADKMPQRGVPATLRLCASAVKIK